MSDAPTVIVVNGGPDEDEDDEDEVEEEVEQVEEVELDHAERIAVIEATYVTRDDMAVVAASINELGTRLDARIDALAVAEMETQEEVMEQEIEAGPEEVEEVPEEVEEAPEEEAPEVVEDASPLSKVHLWWKNLGSRG